MDCSTAWITPGGAITGAISIVSSGLNWIRFIPPIATPYWSCLPIGSPSMPISTSQASAARSLRDL